MKTIKIGMGKTTELNANKLGGEIVTAMINDVSTTQGKWKHCKYLIEFEINIDEPELQIKAILIRPLEPKSKLQEDKDSIDEFQKEIKKVK